MKIEKVLLALTIIPVILAILFAPNRGCPHIWSGGRVWMLDDTPGIKSSFLLPEPKSVFDQEKLHPAEGVKVIIYYRPGEEVESIEATVSADGDFDMFLIGKNDPYILEFKKDGKVLWRTSPLCFIDVHGMEFLLVEGESVQGDSMEYAEANLKPNSYPAPKFITSQSFLTHYAGFTMATLIVILVIYIVRKIVLVKEGIKEQDTDDTSA